MPDNDKNFAAPQKVRSLAITASLVAAGCLLNACNSGDDRTQAPLAACAATMAADRSITLPGVQTADGTYRYTLVPTPTDADPGQYLSTRQSVDVSQLGCLPVQFSTQGQGVLRADGISRQGQLVSVTFEAQPGTNATAFNKTDGSATGLLDGEAGELTPVVAGNVVVTNMAGAVVATGRTNDFGALVVLARSLPDSFKVAVSGGTMSGAPFLGSLKAEIENYTTVERAVVVTLTPVTTLVAAYHERYPGLSLNESMERVKQQLGMPQRLDIDADDQGSSDYFDSAAFYTAARAAGNVDTLVQQVLDDWEAGTPHAFAPAVAVDVQLPTLLMKELLPPGDLPNFKCVDQPCGEAPLALDIATSIVGTAYTIYAGEQTAKFEAVVTSKLAAIQAEVRQVKGLVRAVGAEAKRANYFASHQTIRPTEELSIVAMDGLVWLTKHPEKDYKPANQTCAQPFPPREQRGQAIDAKALSPECARYAYWLEDVKDRIANIKLLNDNEDELLIMNNYKTALAGSDKGMLYQYRLLVVGRLEPIEGQRDTRQFFTPDDSKLIWDHYRYWETIQGLTYFFLADRLVNVSGTTRINAFAAKYKEALDAGKAAMPMRVLPTGTYIDPYNTTFTGIKASPTPLMWFPSPRTLCNIVGPSAFVYEASQANILNYLKCVNTIPNQAGYGLRDWRLPTLAEWRAFTQVDRSPPANFDMGQSLADRGATNARHLNRAVVYAPLSLPPAGSTLYVFDRTRLHNYPFIQIGVQHDPGLAGSTQTLPAGEVVPVRVINTNEYY